MRHIQLLVPDEQRASVTAALEENGIDFVVIRGGGEMDDSWIIEFPLPTDGVGDILRAVRSAGLDEEAYTVIGSAEAAITPNNETLMNRYASDFDPLSRPELRSKARDLSRDPTSFAAMIFLSAVIATAGLLVNSPAVIVGSMVIAPIVGPVLTAGVGAVTGDREMLVHSIWLQAAGLLITIVGAAGFSVLLKSVFMVPPELDLGAIESIATRIAPSFLSVAVGVSAGAAAAFGLTTKGPTSLIGVMIAAALIPTAATVGIGIAWGHRLIVIGTLLLLAATMITINLGVFGMLRYLGYQSDEAGTEFLTGGTRAQTAALLGTAVILVAVVVATGVGTYQQVTFEQTVNQEVQNTIDRAEYSKLEIVEIRPQYAGSRPFSSPERITVTLSRTSDRAYPDLAEAIRSRITAETGDSVTVKVRFITYQQAESEAVSRPTPSARAVLA